MTVSGFWFRSIASKPNGPAASQIGRSGLPGQCRLSAHSVTHTLSYECFRLFG